MSYRAFVKLCGQPSQAQYQTQPALVRTLLGERMPNYYIAVGDIGAVLWDPAEGADAEGDHTYLLMVGGEELTVYSNRPAAAFLCWLFDSHNPQRDWQTRRPTRAAAVDFATHESWRCSLCLPTTSVRECCVALVPAHVTAVIGQPREQVGGVQLQGRKAMLPLRTNWTVRSLAAWLFDADKTPSGPEEGAAAASEPECAAALEHSAQQRITPC